MRKQFDNQLKELNLDMIKMASNVEEAITKAVSALQKKDVELAKEAIAYDNVIDDMEKQIEQCCLKLLLHQQPVAKDLRRISTALKMITDMERIGDHASDISEIVIYLANSNSTLSNSEHIHQMAKATSKMLKDSINAYVNSDLELANYVIKEDDTIDALFDTVKKGLVEIISKDGEIGEQALDILMIAKYFERIGDHAVNIAEWVLFSITGVHKNMKIM